MWIVAANTLHADHAEFLITVTKWSQAIFGRKTVTMTIFEPHSLYDIGSLIKKKKKSDRQVWWPIFEIGPLHLTHPSAHTQQWVVNTHTVNMHPEQWAAIAPAPGEQLGVRCLSHGIEGGESAVHSQSPPSIPAGPEI